MKKTGILLAHADKKTVQDIENKLKSAGYSIRESAETPEDIERIICAESPDIVLLDIHLTGRQSGVELSRRIVKEYHLPVIFLCAYVEPEMMDEIGYFDPYGFIFKPYREMEMITSIEIALERLNKERWMLSILNGLSEGVIATDKQGNIKYCNHLAKEYLGYPRERILRDENLQELLNAAEIRKEPGFFELPHEYFKGSLLKNIKKNLDIEQKVMPVRQGDGEGLLFVLKDITDKSRTERELKESLEKLRRAMGGVIQAMALTVEIRDPYTAGHQRRVANIARAIGNEMGLDPEMVNGLRLAGVVHDLGKIYIPTEILTKPSKLTDLEFGLIKQHPVIAFDILKNIEFPWPVAKIVQQHHERLDGSGYPDGLKGEEIIMESRILAVADVVEAMTSSRPYRPALGWPSALQEIKKYRGTFYDAEVVDAYIRLIGSGEFTIE